MKKIFIFLVVILAFNSKSNAQGLCSNNNCNNPYEQFVEFTENNPLVLKTGCEVTNLTVFYKVCQDGSCNFRFTPPQLPPDCEDYYNDPGQFLDDIMEAILETMSYACKPTRLNDCKENIEFYLSSCWKWDGIIPIDPNDPQPTLIPCEDSGCCRIIWQVCKVSENPDVFEAVKTLEQEVTSCTPSEDCLLIICE